MTTKTTKALNSIFSIEESPIISPIRTITTDDEHEANQSNVAEDDLIVTRRNLYELIGKGTCALDNIMEIAKQSESPRCYEVLTTLLKTLADINHQVVDLHEKGNKLARSESSSQQQPTNVTQNNALFVGSTSELHKMIANLSKDISLNDITGI